MITRHFLVMAANSLRRGILNQHVLLQAGAFAGLIGGVIGLAAAPDDYPTAGFFAVSVLVVTYHTFSEWLSLLVRTRSSQSVKKLLGLQPDTVRVVRDGEEREVPVEDVEVGELARIRPGERNSQAMETGVRAFSAEINRYMLTGLVLRCEEGRGSLEQIALLLETQVLTAQSRELFALVGRDTVIAFVAIEFVLAAPVAQRLLRDAEALQELARRPAGAQQLNRLAAELVGISGSGPGH